MRELACSRHPPSGLMQWEPGVRWQARWQWVRMGRWQTWVSEVWWTKLIIKFTPSLLFEVVWPPLTFVATSSRILSSSYSYCGKECTPIDQCVTLWEHNIFSWCKGQSCSPMWFTEYLLSDWNEKFRIGYCRRKILKIVNFEISRNFFWIWVN